MDFATFALSHLPVPPARVLEVGCGRRGGITPTLGDAGYDAIGIDPGAPSGERFRSYTLEAFPEEQFDAVVAERVFHHVDPLEEAVDKLAQMTSLVILDEFAWDRLDDETRDWYESQHRALSAAGRDPIGPRDLRKWREEHDDLHPWKVVRDGFARRFEERYFEWRPYLYRWLAGPATEALEAALIGADAIRAIGFRWVGVRR